MNGERIYCKFKNNQGNGKGIYFKKNGQKIYGNWKDNIYQEQEKKQKKKKSMSGEKSQNLKKSKRINKDIMKKLFIDNLLTTSDLALGKQKDVGAKENECLGNSKSIKENIIEKKTNEENHKEQTHNKINPINEEEIDT